MAYGAKIIADSMAPCGKRLTTMEVTFPRIVLAEFNTHRQFSRNSASSRAIPVEKMIQRVLDDPFVPEKWPVNQKGMQAQEFLTDTWEIRQATSRWLDARDSCVDNARRLTGLLLVARSNAHSGHGTERFLNVHKQIANRLLEPWLWHTVIVSSTEWGNFWAQRCHPDAQPEIQTIAFMMQHLYCNSEPVEVEAGGYHLPFLQPDEVDLPAENKIRLCVARCARVSYLTHDGKRDHQADFDLYERLRTGMHMSPLEHVAMASLCAEPYGNFVGWEQHRKAIPNECR